MYVYNEWMVRYLLKNKLKMLEYAVRIKLKTSTIHRSLIDNL